MVDDMKMYRPLSNLKTIILKLKYQWEEKSMAQLVIPFQDLSCEYKFQIQ